MKLPRNNAYQCEYGCLMVTVDVDAGVTPFMIKCRTKSRPDRPLKRELMDENGECKGMARSCFYPKSPLPKHYKPPQWEWALPSEEEIKLEVKRAIKMGSTEKEVRDYYNGEHLYLRPRTDREPVYHED